MTDLGRTVTQKDIQDVVDGMLADFVAKSKKKQAEFDAMKRSRSAQSSTCGGSAH